MTNFLPNFAYPYPFNKVRTNYDEGLFGRIFFENSFKIREFKNDVRQSVLLNNKVEKLAKWVKKLEKENPDYELEDTQLIFKPKYPPLQRYGIIGAKICMRKKEKISKLGVENDK